MFWIPMITAALQAASAGKGLIDQNSARAAAEQANKRRREDVRNNAIARALQGLGPELPEPDQPLPAVDYMGALGNLANAASSIGAGIAGQQATSAAQAIQAGQLAVSQAAQAAQERQYDSTLKQNSQQFNQKMLQDSTQFGENLSQQDTHFGANLQQQQNDSAEKVRQYINDATMRQEKQTADITNAGFDNTRLDAGLAETIRNNKENNALDARKITAPGAAAGQMTVHELVNLMGQTKDSSPSAQMEIMLEQDPLKKAALIEAGKQSKYGPAARAQFADDLRGLTGGRFSRTTFGLPEAPLAPQPLIQPVAGASDVDPGGLFVQETAPAALPVDIQQVLQQVYGGNYPATSVPVYLRRR